jgi:hypothetical protein
MSDLIERLRSGKFSSDAELAETLLATADILEAKDAEIAGLREALFPSPQSLMELMDVVLQDMGEPNPPWSKQKLRQFYWNIARATLAEDDTPGEKERE